MSNQFHPWTAGRSVSAPTSQSHQAGDRRPKPAGEQRLPLEGVGQGADAEAAAALAALLALVARRLVGLLGQLEAVLAPLGLPLVPARGAQLLALKVRFSN